MNKFTFSFAAVVLLSQFVAVSWQKGKMYENPQDIIMSHRKAPGEKKDEIPDWVTENTNVNVSQKTNFTSSNSTKSPPSYYSGEIPLTKSFNPS